MQQYLPFTVLKLYRLKFLTLIENTISSCNSTYRLRYWNFNMPWWHRIVLRLQQYLPFTVLKLSYHKLRLFSFWKLQQYLPFTVLKPSRATSYNWLPLVATVLTVYGIETHLSILRSNLVVGVATVLTVYGIETKKQDLFLPVYRMVATVFTACGI